MKKQTKNNTNTNAANNWPGDICSSICCQSKQPKERKGKERKGKTTTASKLLTQFTGHSPVGTTKELLEEGWVLRLHDNEFHNFCQTIKGILPQWHPTLKDFETDMRKLIYSPWGKKSDEKKLKLLYNLLNLTKEKLNWAQVIMISVRVVSSTPNVREPFRFIHHLINNPYKLASHDNHKY